MSSKQRVIPIVFCINDNYAPYTAVAMASFCHFTKSFIKFYIIHSNITEFHKKMIEELSNEYKNFSVEFIQKDIKLYDNLPNIIRKGDFISKDAYSRLFIPEIIKEDRVIYSDVDVIALGDISNALTFYYSGFMLIDCNKWREENITEKLINTIMDRKFSELCEQIALNCVLKNDIKKLDNKYCYTNKFCKINDYYTKTDIVIRHFEGDRKPWDYCPCSHNNIGGVFDWWYFAKKTSFYPFLMQSGVLNTREIINDNVNIINDNVNISNKIRKRNRTYFKIVLLSYFICSICIITLLVFKH